MLMQHTTGGTDSSFLQFVLQLDYEEKANVNKLAKKNLI